MRLRNGLRQPRREKESSPDTADRERARKVIREFAASHATLFERAERLRARADRLESEGTPSDSALNRAERAEKEVAAELVGLRTAFLEAFESREGQLAFDLEVGTLYPSLDLLAKS